MAGRDFYQVFRARPCPGAPRMLCWTWQRLDAQGIPIVHGGRYRTLPQCFAALKRDRAVSGTAPVAIDLDGASIGEASSVVALSVREPDVTITGGSRRMNARPAPEHA